MKRITIFLLASIFVVTVHAQVSYGPRFAVNFSGISFSGSDYKTSLVPGITFGGFVNYELNEKMALQGELLYSAEGNKWKIEEEDLTGTIRSGQIRVPLQFQYAVAEKIYLEAGPQVSFLLAMSQKVEGDKHDISDNYKKLWLGYAAGFGYRFTGKMEGLSAGFRYFSELGDINKVNVGGGNLKPFGFMLGVQYKL